MRERLQEFLDYKGLKVAKAESMSGISNGTLANFLKGTNIQINNLAKFSKAFKDLNYHWLVTGEGSMLLEEDVVVGESEPLYVAEDAKSSIVRWMQKVEEDLKSLQDELKTATLEK